MKILVTGAGGFIGNSLAHTLATQGHQIIAMVRKTSADLVAHQNIEYVKDDITDFVSIAEAVKDCEQVYHVAGYAKLWAADRKTFFDINVSGTENVLKASMEAGVKKLVYTSSCAVFGPSLLSPITENDPRITAFTNDYDLSKFFAETAVKEYCTKGLNAVIVNPSRVYGPGLTTHVNMISKFVLKARKGKTVFVPYIKNVIGNYAYIDDVVNGHIQAMAKGRSGERYIIGGENLDYGQVFQIVKDEIPSARLITLPARAVRVWGNLELIRYKLTGKKPTFTPDAAKRYLQDAAFDCTKAISELGYSITGFREGIRNIYAEKAPQTTGRTSIFMQPIHQHN
ncbi:MAG: NAD-dependent epimerase/dehydratase family protein [Chitinophagaceae bacterium]|nr:MAG: NAD-dependent epimerase/dehydratase family protein [Chitinophagaceae bacterium]